MRTSCSFRMWSLRNACEGCKRKHNGHLNWSKLGCVRLESDKFGIGWLRACDTNGVVCCNDTAGRGFDNFAVNSCVFCIIAHRNWSQRLPWFDCAGIWGAMGLLDLEHESREPAWKYFNSNGPAAPTWKERKVKIGIRHRVDNIQPIQEFAGSVHYKVEESGEAFTEVIIYTFVLRNPVQFSLHMRMHQVNSPTAQFILQRTLSTD